MIDGAATTEAGDAAASPAPRDEELASLEQRVRRLEDAVASMQDTSQLEERVVERLIRAAPPAQPVTATPPPDSAGLLLDTGRRLLPAAVDVLQAGAHAADAHAAAAPGTRDPWLVVDAYAEVRAMVRMYVDRRYRMTWVGRTVPLLLFIALMTSWVWFPGLSAAFTVSQFFGLLLMKPVDLVLAYFLIRVLGREARRYREAVAQLPARRVA